MVPADNFARLRRRMVDAGTRFGRAAGLAHWYATHSDEIHPLQANVLANEAESLLSAVLGDADLLADVLDDRADLEGLERAAGAVRDTLRRRRLARNLSSTEGRTPEEAAAFEAKAQELRR